MKKSVIVLSAFILALTAVCTGCSKETNASQKSLPSTEVPVSLDETEDIQVSLDNRPEVPAQGGAGEKTKDTVPYEGLLSSYYKAQNGPVFEYFQHNSIQRFVGMWVEEATDIKNPQWNFDSFAELYILDHDFETASREGDELYFCTFSDGVDRYGYLIFRYEAEGPGIQQYSLFETTPYLYDLEANLTAIAQCLEETDIDLSTATAQRVSWIDRVKKRGDQIILFTDGKGDRYICYLGDDDFTLEKIENKDK